MPNAPQRENLSPRGELTISVSQIMGRVHVMPVVEEFMRAFPDVRMRVLLNDRRVDLIEEDVRLCIRVSPPSGQQHDRVACGAFPKGGLRRSCIPDARGVPKKPADLASHDCVAYDRAIIPGSGGSVSASSAQKRPLRKFQSVSVLSSIRSKPPRVLQLPGLALSGCPHISPTISLSRVCW